MEESPTTAVVQPIEIPVAPSSQDPINPAPAADPTPQKPEPIVADTGRIEVGEPAKPQDAKDGVPQASFEGVARDAEGNLVWTSETGSVYKGKDEKELFGNMAKGVTEKDSYISKLKAKTVTAESLRQAVVPPTPAQEIKFPEREEIFNETFKKLGVAPEMNSWTPDQWIRYASENTVPDFLISEQRQAVRQARNIAEQTYAERNVVAFNGQTIEDETSNVEDMIAENGVTADQFDYKKLLDDVRNDPKAKNAAGLLKPGVITARAEKLIRQIKSGALKESAKQQADAEIAKAQAALRQIKPEGSPRGVFQPPKPKVAMSTREAANNILREMGIRS
jgi:hypothetical protein